MVWREGIHIQQIIKYWMKGFVKIKHKSVITKQKATKVCEELDIRHVHFLGNNDFTSQETHIKKEMCHIHNHRV